MSSGPEHYREAERLLTRAADSETPVALYQLRRAQVHATLALAAATIDASGFGVRGERSATRPSGRWWLVPDPQPSADGAVLALIALPDSDYLFHDGEWWVRSTAARQAVAQIINREVTRA